MSPARWTIVVGLAAAACFVLVVVLRTRDQDLADAQPARSMKLGSMPSLAASALTAASVNAANDASSSVDELLDQLVALHANPLPPEEKNPENLGRLEPFVGVPVKRSALTMMKVGGLIQVGGRAQKPSFDGARIHPVREARGAAALRYVVDGHRITVYVFDPHVLPLGKTRLRPRVVRAGEPPQLARAGASDRGTDVPVYVGSMRGFSVAAAERAGIGYALASDLDEEKSVRMVASF